MRSRLSCASMSRALGIYAAASFIVAYAAIAAAQPGGGHGVAVTPDAGSLSVIENGSYSATFTIENTGTMEDEFALTCGRTGAVTSCSVTASVALNASASTQVNVNYTTGGYGSGTLTLHAESMWYLFVEDDGDYHVTVNAGISVVISAVSGPSVVEPGAQGTFTFRAHSVSIAAQTYTFSCTTTGSATCQVQTPSILNFDPNEDREVLAYATGGSTAGPASITLTATGPATDSETQNFTVQRLGMLSLAFTGGDKVLRANCPITSAGLGGGAVQCGDLVYAHAFPGYRSMAKPRTLTLLYNSGSAKPTPIVALDYSIWPGDVIPTLLKVRVEQTSGPSSFGAIEKYYSTANFNTSTKQVHRMSIPIAGDNLSTGAYGIKVSLTRYINGQPQSPDTISGRVLIVNRRSSAFGAGWWPAGVELLYPQADGSAMLVLADGSALFYRKVGSSYVSPPGEYSTLVKNADNTWRRTSQDTRIKVNYDASGRVTSIRDTNPVPKQATYHWGVGERVDSITDAAGMRIRLTYSGPRVSKVMIPAVDSIRLYTSVPSGATYANLDSIRDPDGYKIRFTYGTGASHRMISSTPRALVQQHYRYNEISRVDSSWAGIILLQKYLEWQRFGAPLNGTGTQSSPASTALAPDIRTAFTRYRWEGEYTGTWEPVEVTYRTEPFGSPVYRAQPLLYPHVTLDRDSVGNVTHGITPDAGEFWQQWNADGTLARTIRRYVKDDYTPARYDTTTYQYHPVWKAVTKVVPPIAAESTTVQYDSYGRQWKVKDALGRETRFEYTSRGQLYQIWGPGDNFATTYTYDPSTFNPTQISDGLAATTYAYYANGSDVQTVTQSGMFPVVYEYDAMKRPTRIMQGSKVIRYEHDDAARLTRQYDPLDHMSVTYRDGLGRVNKNCIRHNWCDSLGYGVVQHHFQPTEIKKRNGLWIEMEYDVLGRVTAKHLGSLRNLWTPIDDDIGYFYDGAGRMTVVTNRYARVYRSYDSYGQLFREEQQVKEYLADNFRSVKASHESDRMGRRIRSFIGDTWDDEPPCIPQPVEDPEEEPICTPRPGYEPPTDTISYAYRADGALAEIRNTLWPGATTKKWTYTYDTKGRLERLDLPGTSSYNTWGYNDHNQLTSYNSSFHVGVAITPDDLGRVNVWNGWKSETYNYDNLGRLGSTAGSHVNESYTYDANGNRLADNTYVYRYNDRGQLYEKEVADCIDEIFYDGNGNEIENGWWSTCTSESRGRKMSYDQGDRMTEMITVENGGSNGWFENRRTFWYDGLGRRVMAATWHTYSQQWGVVRYWWLDDNVAVKSFNYADTTGGSGNPLWIDREWPRLERDSLGAVSGKGEWFFYGPGPDNLLGSWNYRHYPGEYHLFYKDDRGSVIGVKTTGGYIRARSASHYLPFGGIPGGSPSAASENPGYNGQEATGGLVYMRNRWYDPNTGRFTQQDPIQFAGGINLYAYAGANPISFWDPFGLCPKDDGGDGKTEEVADCPEGSSGWYAHRIATGQGNAVVNNIGGTLASCGESAACMGTLAVASLGAAGLASAGAGAATSGGVAAGVAQGGSQAVAVSNGGGLIAAATGALIRAETSKVGSFVLGLADGTTNAMSPSAAPMESMATTAGRLGQIVGFTVTKIATEPTVQQGIAALAAWLSQ